MNTTLIEAKLKQNHNSYVQIAVPHLTVSNITSIRKKRKTNPTDTEVHTDMYRPAEAIPLTHPDPRPNVCFGSRIFFESNQLNKIKMIWHKYTQVRSLEMMIWSDISNMLTNISTCMDSSR